MSDMRTLIASMLRIGCCGFGGGNALVPVIERELTEENNLLSKEEYDKDVVVANITPGALPVELAAGAGYKIAGRKGMLAAATAMALPGSLLTVSLLALFSVAGEVVTRQIRFASVGIVALIVFLLLSYSLETILIHRFHERELEISVLLIIVVFGLTNGKAINEIFGLENTPLFAVSTLNVLAITFFVICFTRGKFERGKTILAVGISLLYLLSVGKAGVISSLAVRHGLQLLMLVLGGHGLLCSLGGEENRLRTFPWKSLLRESLTWVAYIAVFSLPAVLLCPQGMMFVGKAIASVFLSFGGGDAYLVIAKGLFVGSDMISRNEFYGQIATVANAMPGSILCKVLSGVGFCLGGKYGVLPALCTAMAGFACGVGASGLTIQLVYRIYDQFENLDIFQAIKRYIRPIIGGLLLTVAISLLNETAQVGISYGIPTWVLFAFSLVILGLIIVLRGSRQCRLVVLIVISAAVAVPGCNVLNWIF